MNYQQQIKSKGRPKTSWSWIVEAEVETLNKTWECCQRQTKKEDLYCSPTCQGTNEWNISCYYTVVIAFCVDFVFSFKPLFPSLFCQKFAFCLTPIPLITASIWTSTVFPWTCPVLLVLSYASYNLSFFHNMGLSYW